MIKLKSLEISAPGLSHPNGASGQKPRFDSSQFDLFFHEGLYWIVGKPGPQSTKAAVTKVVAPWRVISADAFGPPEVPRPLAKTQDKRYK